MAQGAVTTPRTLAVMHGSSCTGDGAAVIEQIAGADERACHELCRAGGTPAVPEQAAAGARSTAPAPGQQATEARGSDVEHGVAESWDARAGRAG
jgi:hypothetical protein